MVKNRWFWVVFLVGWHSKSWQFWFIVIGWKEALKQLLFNSCFWFPYTTYIPLIYCQLGDYMLPTTYWGNQETPLIFRRDIIFHVSNTHQALTAPSRMPTHRWWRMKKLRSGNGGGQSCEAFYDPKVGGPNGEAFGDRIRTGSEFFIPRIWEC